MVTVGITTPQGSDDAKDCLKTRYWFYYLASSLVVFFAGVIVILIWRIIEHFAGCGFTSVISGRPSSNSDRTNIAARIKWKCEKLVSGQTPVGRIMVSCIITSVVLYIKLYMADIFN